MGAIVGILWKPGCILWMGLEQTETEITYVMPFNPKVSLVKA